jgi:hypothetical protein
MMPLLFALMLSQAAPAPGWEYRESSNAETGTKSAWAFIRDPDGQSRLIVRCDVVKEAIVSVQFIPKLPLAAGASRVVTLTLDSSKAEMAPWELPGRGAYVAEPPTVYIYASSFAAAKQIEVGMLDDAGQPIGGNFAGPGGNEQFRKVFAACGREYAMPAVVAAKK